MDGMVSFEDAPLGTRSRAPRIVVIRDGKPIIARWQGIKALRASVLAIIAAGYKGKPRWSQRERCWVLPVQDKQMPQRIVITMTTEVAQ